MKSAKVLIGICSLLLLAGTSWASSNLALNGSFEDPQVSGEWAPANPLNGWQLSLGSSVGLIKSGVWGMAPAPDGNQCLFLNGHQLTSFLPAVVEPNTKYDLSVWLGADSYSQPNPYDAQLGVVSDIGYANYSWDGWLTIAADSNTQTPAMSTWTEIKLSYTSAAANDPIEGGPIGKYLAIWISGGTYGTVWTYFDNVVLTSAPAVIAEPGSISGTINLQDYAGELDLASVRIELREPNTTNALVTTYVTLSANGEYSVPNIAPGNYDAAFSACKWLKKVVSGVTVVTLQDTVVNADLVNGDVDGDNEITSTDLSILGLGLGLIGDL